MSEQQQEPMWKRPVGYKPRVYQVTPGSMIWWADVKARSGAYYAKLFFTREEAFRKAHEYAALVSK